MLIYIAISKNEAFCSTFFGTELHISSLCPSRIETKDEVFSILCLLDNKGHSRLFSWNSGLQGEVIIIGYNNFIS